MNEETEVLELAKRIRLDSLRMTSVANASHIGSCLSIADILAVLYSGVLRIDPINPEWPERDRFIMSKGHAAAACFAVLAEKGFFDKKLLDTYCHDGSILGGHVTRGVPGVEISTGSLGHGLSIGGGMALWAKRLEKSYRTFVVLSDGECDEGSTWEAALFASHHKLDNLTVIIDYNKIQSFGFVKEVLDLEPLVAKWESFGWKVTEIDGHNIREIRGALSQVPFERTIPSCLVAHTVKGKGVSFMENNLAWHYKSANREQLDQAVDEIVNSK